MLFFQSTTDFKNETFFLINNAEPIHASELILDLAIPGTFSLITIIILNSMN